MADSNTARVRAAIAYVFCAWNAGSLSSAVSERSQNGSCSAPSLPGDCQVPGARVAGGSSTLAVAS